MLKKKKKESRTKLNTTENTHEKSPGIWEDQGLKKGLIMKWKNVYIYPRQEFSFAIWKDLMLLYFTQNALHDRGCQCSLFLHCSSGFSPSSHSSISSLYFLHLLFPFLILSQCPNVYLSVSFKLTVDLVGAPQRLVSIRIEQGDKLTEACFISAQGSYYT